MPNSEPRLWARFWGSSALPPSPIVKKSRPFGANAEHATVVIDVRIRAPEQQARAPRDRLRAVGAVLDNPRVAAVVRVLDVEAPVLAVLRMECESQQALLAAREHEIVDVEERLGAASPRSMRTMRPLCSTTYRRPCSPVGAPT